jgi:uncharacterized protein
VPQTNNLLRLNVGFLINQPVGYSRDFLFDIPRISLSEDLDLNNLSGVAQITRTSQGLLVQVKLHATLLSECVRCLIHYNQSLNTNFTELYAFSKDSITESELILPEDGHIDLDPLVREYMLLEVPISPICRSDCKGLCQICGNNLNVEQCQHDDETIDPRLSKLKTLLEEND